MEGYNIPAQSYVDIYNTMINIQHLLQSEKTTHQSEQGLGSVTEGEKNMSSVAKSMNAQFNASAL